MCACARMRVCVCTCVLSSEEQQNRPQGTASMWLQKGLHAVISQSLYSDDVHDGCPSFQQCRLVVLSMMPVGFSLQWIQIKRALCWGRYHHENVQSITPGPCGRKQSPRWHTYDRLSSQEFWSLCPAVLWKKDENWCRIWSSLLIWTIRKKRELDVHTGKFHSFCSSVIFKRVATSEPLRLAARFTRMVCLFGSYAKFKALM